MKSEVVTIRMIDIDTWFDRVEDAKADETERKDQWLCIFRAPDGRYFRLWTSETIKHRIERWEDEEGNLLPVVAERVHGEWL